MSNSPKHSALYLLERIIEYVNMTSNETEWTFEEQKGNPPRFVRLQQIQSLMDAFVPELMASENIRKSIGNFFTGSFITKRTLAAYSGMLELIYHTIGGSRFTDTKKKILDVYDLQSSYCDLMDYYLKLKNLLCHNRSDLEVSYPNIFSYLVTESISESIHSEAEYISCLLGEFIDPGNHAYTEDELVSQFNYPTVDLLDMELRWM